MNDPTVLLLSRRRVPGRKTYAIRLTPTLIARMKAAAETSGMTAGAWLEEQILQGCQEAERRDQDGQV